MFRHSISGLGRAPYQCFCFPFIQEFQQSNPETAEPSIQSSVLSSSASVHTYVSQICCCMLVANVFLVHHFRRGGDNYYEPLRNVYLYDVIISVLAIAGGMLICL